DHWGIKNFHTTDFVSREEEFKNTWTDDERRQFIVRLAHVAVSHMDVGYNCVIRGDEYAEMDLPSDWEDHFRNPHGFCIWTILGMLAHNEMARRAGHVRLSLPKLELVFDDNPKFNATALSIFNARRMVDKESHILAGLAFRTDDDVI